MFRRVFDSEAPLQADSRDEVCTANYIGSTYLVSQRFEVLKEKQMLQKLRLHMKFKNFNHQDRMFLVKLYSGGISPIGVRITNGRCDSGLRRSYAPDDSKFIVFGGVAWRAYSLLSPRRFYGDDLSGHQHGVDFVFYHGLPAFRLAPNANIDEQRLIDSWLEAHHLRRGQITDDYVAMV